MEKEVYIISGSRSPIGDFGGALKKVSTTDLAIQVIRSVIEKAGMDIGMIERVFMGNTLDPANSNIARIASVKAGVSQEAPGITVSCNCGSAMQALSMGAESIRNGEADVVLVGGIESMSRAPYICEANRWGQRLRHGKMIDIVWRGLQEYPLGVGMGLTAENVAQRDHISREDQDKLAATSHKRAVTAIREGKFKKEITPIKIPVKNGKEMVVDTDEHPREDATMAKLSALPPAFMENGTVTAGNSSSLNDGAACVVMMSYKRMKELNATPVGRFVGSSVVGVDPDYMGDGPVPATRKLLKKTGISIHDIGLFEINEAFAAQYLSCERALGLDREITNVNGSGVALGHPVGCTGTRLVVTLINEMQRRKTKYGLASLCSGGGHGFATIIEGI
ncbi:MAG: thiolase family protein [Desulfobacula sp.]|nr:thiolase family protein [Desulfobacula sp.]